MSKNIKKVHTAAAAILAICMVVQLATFVTLVYVANNTSIKTVPDWFSSFFIIMLVVTFASLFVYCGTYNRY